MSTSHGGGRGREPRESPYPIILNKGCSCHTLPSKHSGEHVSQLWEYKVWETFVLVEVGQEKCLGSSSSPSGSLKVKVLVICR